MCIECVKCDAFRELCFWKIQYVMTLAHKAKVYLNKLWSKPIVENQGDSLQGPG